MKKSLAILKVSFAWTAVFLGVFLLLAAPAWALSQQPAAVAAPAAATAPVTLPMGGSLWKGILNGAIAGTVAVFLGFMKNKDPKTGEMESFDFKYAFPTMVVGALVGIVAALLKMTPDDLVTALTTSPVYGAIVFAAEAGLKAIFRHSVPWIRDALAMMKSAPGNPTAPPPATPPKP